MFQCEILQDKNKFTLFLSLTVPLSFSLYFSLVCIFFLYSSLFLFLSLFLSLLLLLSLFLSFWWRKLLAGQVLGGQEIIHDGAAILSGEMWPQTSAILSTRHQSCKSDLFHTYIYSVKTNIIRFDILDRRRPQSCPATLPPICTLRSFPRVANLISLQSV